MLNWECFSESLQFQAWVSGQLEQEASWIAGRVPGYRGVQPRAVDHGPGGQQRGRGHAEVRPPLLAPL